MDSPRRSPRIAERNGAAPRTHVALQEEHPYKDILRQKRVHFNDIHERNNRVLCIATAIVGLAWTGFFAVIVYNESLSRTTPFQWELLNIYP
jgi:hypothetical protein